MLAAFPVPAQETAQPALEQDVRMPGVWTELEAGYDGQNLDNGQQDWSEAFAGVAHRDGAGRTWLGRAAHVRRFDQDDTTLLGAAYLPLAAKTVLYGEVFASPTHNIMAKWSALLQVEQGLTQGFGVLAGARRTEYNASTLDALYLGAEKYFGDFRLAYTWSPTHSDVAGDGYGNLAQFSWYYAPLNRVSLAYSWGKEVDRPDLGITSATYVSGWALYGRHMFAPSMGLGYVVAHNRQGSLYDRDGVSVSVIYRF